MMAYCSRLRVVVLLLFLVSLFLFLLPVSLTYAFVEDFNADFSNPSVWNLATNSGTIAFSGSHLQLLNSSKTNSFPYVKSVGDIFPSSGSFGVKIDFNFLSAGNFGDGMAISPISPPNGTMLGPNLSRYLLFWIWHDPSGLGFYTTVCPETNPGCTQQYTQIYSFSSPNFGPHFIALSMDQEGRYHFFLDSDTNEIFTSSTNQPRPTSIWLGSPEQTFTVDNWNSLQIDRIEIQDSYPFPSPTPTPTPESLRPIIVIPGLGASWDWTALLPGLSGSNWKIPQKVDLYNNLIDSLENAGYEKDKNLFVYAYDWRKKLYDAADDLNGYISNLIENNKIKATDKIDFIGHSLGGLVARTYGQKIGTEKIDKIITAGSPHQGALAAYSAWEGAIVRKAPWWQRIPLELPIQLGMATGARPVAVLRRLAPGIKDTLPTFDFLKKDGALLSSNLLLQKNTTLFDLNNDVSGINSLLWANGGIGLDTDRAINVIDRDWRDRALGEWEDGRPTANSAFETSTEGDDTVLAFSSLGLFSNQKTADSSHGGIISDLDSIKNIFDQLGLDKSKAVANTVPDLRQSVFVASLRSPGTLQVCNTSNICDNDLGVYIPDEKLFFLPGYDNEILNVSVAADGSVGNYRLYLGDLSEGESNWDSTGGNLVTASQVDTYQAVVESGKLEIKGDSGTLLRSLDVDAAELTRLLPMWDKGNRLAIARSDSQPRNKRIVAIRQLREVLHPQIVKAYKGGRFDQVEAIIAVWKDIDHFAETVIGDGNSTKIAFLEANIRAVGLYQAVVESLLRNSSSYYAAAFYELFENNFSRAKEIKSTQRDLSLDKVLSARYLLLTALGVR